MPITRIRSNFWPTIRASFWSFIATVHVTDDQLVCSSIRCPVPIDNAVAKCMRSPSMPSMPVIPMYNFPPLPLPHRRTRTSKHGILHSRVPNRLLSHPNPIPVHSGLGCSFLPRAVIATPASDEAVSFTAFIKKEASPLHCPALSDRPLA